MRVGSLFAGIGGFDLAFERAGCEIVWHVEVDESCRRTLAARFDSQPFVDVRDCGVHNLPAVDVLVGGWPCQPVSVAGKRGASADERDMWPEFARIAGELRPAWVVGENVPGALTAEGGTYWRHVVDDLTQLGYGVVWRTLDAQHFGVPQRRRRVFVVGCLGDLGRAAKVLLEPESGVRDSSTREQAGEIAAGHLARSLGGVGGGQDFGANKGTVVTALSSRDEKGYKQGDGLVTSIQVRGRAGGAQAETDDSGVHPALRAGDGGSSRSALIAHTLSAEGHDASEDGTGRGTPLVTQDVAATLLSASHPNSNAPARRREDDVNLVVTPLDIRNASRHDGATGVGTPSTGVGEEEDPSYALSTMGAPPAVAYRKAQRAHDPEDCDVSPPLDAANGERLGDRGLRIAESMSVRRLTPTECERLQGFPDGWTLIEGVADSTRYKQLGNAVAVPCVEWIARRLFAMAAFDGVRE